LKPALPKFPSGSEGANAFPEPFGTGSVILIGCNLATLREGQMLMSDKARSKGRQPEALATFASAARNGGKKSTSISLEATPETAPVSVDLADKADAATKVLREGVLHADQGADAAIDKLPDRVMQPK
jgi:hypothetical protein